MNLFWDEWRGSYDGRPSMWIKRLLAFRGYRLDLHKMVRADDPTCFHTHPAWAFRWILYGGYVEEVDLGDGLHGFRSHRPGQRSWVFPELCHRIHKLLNGRVSYSLWWRTPVTHEITIKGEC